MRFGIRPEEGRKIVPRREGHGAENVLASSMCMDNEVSMAGKLDGTPGVTIYEIAKHLGLSPAAVSSALANRGKERRISAETIRRIREAATELGYVPNMAGRRLRAHKSSVRQFDLAILTSFEAPLP